MQRSGILGVKRMDIDSEWSTLRRVRQAHRKQAQGKLPASFSMMQRKIGGVVQVRRRKCRQESRVGLILRFSTTLVRRAHHRRYSTTQSTANSAIPTAIAVVFSR